MRLQRKVEQQQQQQRVAGLKASLEERQQLLATTQAALRPNPSPSPNPRPNPNPSPNPTPSPSPNPNPNPNLKALKRPQSPAADVQWFFLVSDRSFVHVPLTSPSPSSPGPSPSPLSPPSPSPTTGRCADLLPSYRPHYGKVPRLLARVATLPAGRKGYYGQVASWLG